MYTEQQLKDLTIYLREVAQGLIKKDTSSIDLGKGISVQVTTEEEPKDEDYLTIMDLVKQIEVIYYNPLIFQTILEEYDLPFSLMEDPLDMIALRINDAGPLSKALIQWRLTNGI